ncbi:helix-turn-helix domain-containing protein [Paraburkholderia fungorum]|uniref:IclR family transcriptional regulator n=1 Tax=Paraburkholderia fungorum TaxID=134537 RepID=UPI0038B9737C
MATPAGSGERNAPNGTQSINRAMNLLRLLAAHNESGVRLVDIARESGLRRSTCHRILQCLVSEGMAVERQPGNRYLLGPLAYELGLGAARRYRIDKISHPLLEELAELTEDAVFFSVRSGYYLSCVDHAIGNFPIKAYTRALGDRRPLGFGCAGVAILSLLPQDTIHEIATENRELLAAFGIYDLDGIIEKCLQAKANGFALNSRPTLGLKALAVPVTDAQGRPLGALSLCAISPRIEAERLPFLTHALLETKMKLEVQIRAHSSIETHALFGLDDLSALAAHG